MRAIKTVNNHLRSIKHTRNDEEIILFSLSRYILIRDFLSKQLVVCNSFVMAVLLLIKEILY